MTTFTEGVFHGMPAAEYHNTLALSAGSTGNLLRTVGHFANGVRDGWKPGGGTPSMLLGSLLHTMVLEPDLMASTYVVPPEFNRKTKDGKAEAEAWEKENAGKLFVTADQMSAADGMARSLRNHDAAMLALDGQHEVSAFWRQHGVPCKARFDNKGGGFLGDLKSSSDASPDGFARSCASYGYHRQAAHYLDGHRIAVGEPADGMVFVVVESKAPYAVGVYELDDADIDLGRRQMQRAAARFSEYMARMQTPEDRPILPAAYTEGVRHINLPAWAHYAEEAAA